MNTSNKNCSLKGRHFTLKLLLRCCGNFDMIGYWVDSISGPLSGLKGKNLTGSAITGLLSG